MQGTSLSAAKRQRALKAPKCRNRVMIARMVLTGFALWVAVSEPARADALSSGQLAFQRGDYSAAARMLIPLAERGNAAAQTLLGFMYAYGRGVPQNVVVAAHWYQCAAEQGNATAQYQLGLIYDKGLGVKRSAILAYTWLDLAASHASAVERDYYYRVRDAVASKLNPAQS